MHIIIVSNLKLIIASIMTIFIGVYARKEATIYYHFKNNGAVIFDAQQMSIVVVIT